MTDTQIRKAVARGQGRAILFLREVGGEGYEQLVLSLCCRNQAYDTWFEDRTNYMCRLVDTLPDPAELVGPLGEHLFRSRSRRDRDQIRGILAHLGTAGSAEARDYLLKDFYRFQLKDRSYTDAIDYLGFEGLELLMGQAHRLEDWELSLLFEDAVEAFGKRRAKRVFKHLPEARAAIAINPEWKTKPYVPKPEPSPAEFIERVQTGEFVSYIGFVNRATEQDWKTLAELALATDSWAVLRRLAMVLKRRPWPLDAEAAFARALAEPDPDLRYLRFRMLEGTYSQTIHDWALIELAQRPLPPNSDSAFVLLRLNGERKDLPLMTRALFDLRNDADRFHFAGFDVLDLRCGNTSEMLQILYEYSPCHECRNSAIRQLVKRRATTIEQRKECCEDSDEDTRKWARRSLRGAEN